jgi:putative oxidoreductase
MQNLQKYGLLAVKVLLTLAFTAAGLAKLAGAEMMVQTFEAVGIGQWFRYLTGIIELGGAILLWTPGRQLIGSGLLLCTMIGATFAHFVILGPSAMPAIILGILAALMAYNHRGQSPLR